LGKLGGMLAGNFCLIEDDIRDIKNSAFLRIACPTTSSLPGASCIAGVCTFTLTILRIPQSPYLCRISVANHDTFIGPCRAFPILKLFGEEFVGETTKVPQVSYIPPLPVQQFMGCLALNSTGRTQGVKLGCGIHRLTAQGVFKIQVDRHRSCLRSYCSNHSFANAIFGQGIGCGGLEGNSGGLKDASKKMIIVFPISIIRPESPDWVTRKLCLNMIGKFLEDGNNFFSRLVP